MAQRSCRALRATELSAAVRVYRRGARPRSGSASPQDHLGIDVHKKDSQIYILAQGGEVVEQRTRTEPERFAAGLGPPPRACSTR